MLDRPDTLLELARFICGREDADPNATRLARGYRDLHEHVFSRDSKIVAALVNLANSGWRVALHYAPLDGAALVTLTKPTDALVFAGATHEEVLVQAWEVVRQTPSPRATP